LTGAVCVLVGACSAGGGEKARSPVVLCAAEALRASRDPAVPEKEQNRWRATASLLEEKLPQSRHSETHRQIDQLADESPSSTLIDFHECQPLLNAADQARLEAAAT
jgi:hypothetical protein